MQKVKEQGLIIMLSPVSQSLGTCHNLFMTKRMTNAEVAEDLVKFYKGRNKVAKQSAIKTSCCQSFEHAQRTSHARF